MATTAKEKHYYHLNRTVPFVSGVTWRDCKAEPGTLVMVDHGNGLATGHVFAGGESVIRVRLLLWASLPGKDPVPLKGRDFCWVCISELDSVYYGIDPLLAEFDLVPEFF